MKLIKSVLILMAIVGVTLADTTLHYVDQSDKTTIKMYLSGNKMVVTSTSEQSTSMIYDAKSVVMTIIDAENKKYYILNRDQIESLGDMKAMMEKVLEERLKDMPDSQKEMMRSMMEGILKSQMPKKPKKPTYKTTGKSGNYAGLKCKEVMKQAGENKYKFCVVEPSKLGLSSSEYSTLRSFQAISQKIAERSGIEGTDLSIFDNSVVVYYENKDENGVLRSVNHKNIPTSLFTIPKGFQKIDMPF